MTTIIADYREKGTSFLNILSSLESVELVFTSLPCDYVIDGVRGLVCLERKEVKDFISALTDGRIFSQVKSTIEAYPNCRFCMIIHGSWREAARWSHINMVAAYSAVSSLMVDWGISILHFSNVRDAALFLHSLAKRVSKPREAVEVPIYKPKAKTTYDQAVRLIASLPNISTTLAKNILHAFGSPKEAFDRVDEWDKVKGVGVKIKEAVKRVLYYRVGCEEQ